jgi:hypothetical protein
MKKIQATLMTVCLFLLLGLQGRANNVPAVPILPPYFADLRDIIEIRHLIDAIYPGTKFKFRFVLDSAVDRKKVVRMKIRDSANKKDRIVDSVIFYTYKIGRLVALDSDSSQIKFNSLVNSIYSALTAPPKKDSDQATPASQGKPGAPSPGPQKQPGSGGTYAFSSLKIGELSRWLTPQLTLAEIQNELTAILEVTDGASAENRGLLEQAPQLDPQFKHLEDIKKGLTPRATGAVSIMQSAAGVIGQAGGSITSLAGAFNIDQAKIMEGIVDWFIRSAKQELLESILNGWYETLKKDPIASVLLANTLKTLDQFQQDNSLNLAKYGDLWKASFQQDLRNIPVHLKDEAFVAKVMNLIAKGWPGNREVIPLISGSTNIIYGLYEKKHPVTILSEMSTQYVTESLSYEDDLPVFKRAVIMSDILANIIGRMDGNIYKPISISDLKNLDEESWSDLLALIYLRNKNGLYMVMGKDPIEILGEIRNGPGAKFFGILATAASVYQTVQETISTRVNDNQEATTPTKTLSNDDFVKVMDLALSVVKKTVPYILDKAGLKNDPFCQFIDRDLDGISKNISQIGEGISTKQYGMVLDGSMQLLTYADTAFGVRAGNSVGTRNLIAEIRTITKFGSFMVNILTAKTADEVSNALDELIPKDQYRLKNINSLSVSLSGYPGLFVGHENITKYNLLNGNLNRSDSYTKGGTSLGVYLPVGIDITTGFGNSSLGLFLQAFDLGAILNYRISNTDSTDLSNPNISWQQVISPGASLFYQINNTPLVIGAGFNYTPALRKIQQSGISYDANAFRYGIYLAVDVTAFHLSLIKKKTGKK